MRGSGGTDGGLTQFFTGFGMAGLATYLFFDSVFVRTDGGGMISGMFRGHGHAFETTSMGILFIPFFLGVFALFVDSKQKWAWGLTYLGIAILGVEVLSRIRFYFNTKLTHLGLMIVLFAAGCALMFRSYREDEASQTRPTEDRPDDD